MALIEHQNLQQVAPGLLFGSVHRFQELKKCLLSDCDAWTLKAEKILIHGSFLFGFVSPSQFVWNALKDLLSRTSSQLGNVLNNPSIESKIRMGMSLMEQLGLVYIWDFVRDGSICMRFNNCDNDFLAQLSNIKIKTCNVDDWMDDTRKLSICEQIFNDSPLILLAGGMLLLTIFANSKADTSTPPTPGDNGNPNGDRSPGVINRDNVTSGAADKDITSPILSGSANIGHNGCTLAHANSSLENEPIIFPNFQPPKEKRNPPTQAILAQCPNCCKNFTCTVPKPWTCACDLVFPLTDNKREEDIINQLLKDLKCKDCKEIIKKKLQEYQKKKRQAQQQCPKKSK